MDKKISIIVPIYNTEKYLKRCLDSLIKQEYENIEIILINDGSTDGSLQICEEYKNKDNRIVLIDKIHTGVSHTRNIGLENVSGDYIGFVDSDDYIDKDMFKNLMIGIEKYNADICMCDLEETISEEIENYHEKIELIEMKKKP